MHVRRDSVLQCVAGREGPPRDGGRQAADAAMEARGGLRMDSYFGNKFHPARPVYVLGRSYKAEPTCKPQEKLFEIGWTVPIPTP